MFPIDVLMFSEFRTMRNHLSETLMLNDIQITSDCMSRWVVLKRRVGAGTSQRVTYRPSISIRVIVPYVHVMWEKGTITLVNIAPQSQPELSFLTITACGEKER
jgi:hypothetical protein